MMRGGWEGGGEAEGAQITYSGHFKPYERALARVPSRGGAVHYGTPRDRSLFWSAMDPALPTVVGGSGTLVAAVQEHWEEGLTRLHGLSPHLVFLVDCSFGMIGEVWTLYGITNVGSFGGLPLFTLGKDASAYPHISEGACDFEKAWDFCSGIGALGWGAAHAGMKILGHTDRNWLACAAARLNSSAPIIKGVMKAL